MYARYKTSRPKGYALKNLFSKCVNEIGVAYAFPFLSVTRLCFINAASPLRVSAADKAHDAGEPPSH